MTKMVSGCFCCYLPVFAFLKFIIIIHTSSQNVFFPELLFFIFQRNRILVHINTLLSTRGTRTGTLPSTVLFSVSTNSP